MIEIIPAMDLIDGRCVRLSQGDYSKKTIYSENPLEIATMYEAHGVQRLHLVDLDGAKAGKIINHRILEKIATRTSITIDFGGGLKGDDDLRIAFECGAQMVTGGSIAVKNPASFQKWIDRYGEQAIILGADCRKGKIAVAGWIEDTELEVASFIDSWRKRGISKVICTDIAKDGMMGGANLDLYREIIRSNPDIYLIASGGVGSVSDVERLAEANIPAVIVGKALYEGKISLQQIAKFLC
ncbi:MAG: 1-(5-phosphoribosyl)-5-[(5-phosphoribosylamino)methylideneamino]imidazole-4-carboxamide isomerase [Prevotellaceae bacterium]|jgi:phosphoribosylformimino-5-aminoimidazole carboxamide ribotide isomerase|nr:1-(5-phosphoribosyl)-5-[(5-phosphoribosylamino)methylideneamino]imidazole-4-carboxamide isomerase [Prevotellaceae bacterium]